jgi:hypothetical protein
MKHLVNGLIGLLAFSIAVGCGSGDTASEAKDTTVAATTDSSSFDAAANWKIGIQTWTFNHFTLAQALDKVDSAGVKDIECYWGQPLGADMKGEFGIKMSEDSRTRLKTVAAIKRNTDRGYGCYFA